MNKKQKKIQMTLISIGLILILATYFYYPYTKKSKIIKGQTLQKELQEKTDGKTTFFRNVEYKGQYDLDKHFTIESEQAHRLNEEPGIVYMTNMNVLLYLPDGRIVNIISKRGRYFKETYDCFFEDEVKATEGETIIFADNLDLLATEDYAAIYNNVRLNYPTGSLQADKVDYDFETKYFKISMFDDKMVKMKVIK